MHDHSAAQHAPGIIAEHWGDDYDFYRKPAHWDYHDDFHRERAGGGWWPVDPALHDLARQLGRPTPDTDTAGADLEALTLAAHGKREGLA